VWLDVGGRFRGGGGGSCVSAVTPQGGAAVARAARPAPLGRFRSRGVCANGRCGTPVPRYPNKELVRTRRIRLFNKNTALRRFKTDVDAKLILPSALNVNAA